MSLSHSDADLYAVLVGSDPTPPATFPCEDPESATYWSETPGGDALVIPDLPPNQWVLLYVTAGSDATATYDLVADVKSPSRLYRTAVLLPLGDSVYGAVSAVESDVWSYYEVDVPQAGNVTLTLRRMQGAATLYASVGAPPTLQQFEVTNAGTVDDFVQLQVGTGGVKAYVGVYATVLSTFLLWAAFTPPVTGTDPTAPSTAQLQRLTAGVPFPGRLTGVAFEVFYFYFPSTSGFQQPITIYLDVTSLDGEADMYVSTYSDALDSAGGGTKFPSNALEPPGSWWQAVQYQDDVLSIPTSDPHFCTQACNYTIAVVPWMGRGATFTLTATKSNTTVLFDGVLVRDTVRPDFVRFYDFVPPTSISAVTFTVSQTDGSVALYIDTNQQPNPFNGHFNDSRVGLGELTLTVTPAASWFCNAGQRCMYRLAVVGLSSALGDADTAIPYSIRATTSAVTSSNSTSGGVTQLTNALQAYTFTGAEGSSRYFYLELQPSSTPRTMSITLTSITGDADLYVVHSNSSTTLYANESLFNWASYRTDAVDLIPIPNALPGFYYLTVASFTNCTYRLLATIYDKTPLDDGIPQSGVVAQDAFSYFTFTLSKATPRLTFSLFKTYGEPDLYVMYGAQPNRTSYDNRSISFSADIVTVDSPQLGVWVVGVYGFYDSAVFTLTVSSQNASSWLRVGYSVSGNVSRDLADYYQVQVDSFNNSLTVALTILASSGDCDLLMSPVTQQPTLDTLQYPRDRSSLNLGSDAITITSTDLAAARSSVWYIAVDAFESCLYSLTASFGGITRLDDGKPKLGQVAVGAYNYYAFTVLINGSTPSITFSVSATIGAVQMFVISPSSDTPSSPGLENTDWSTPVWASDGSITITSTDPKYCRTPPSCTYSISVWGGGVQGGTYFITALSNATTRSISTLADGVRVNKQQQASLSSEYYSFENQFPTAAIILTVTPTSTAADPDLYVSTNTSTPSSASFQWRGIQNGADAVYIDPSDAHYILGTYYIGVFCAIATTTCSYAIQARAYDVSGSTNSTAVQLTNNVDVTGLVALGRNNVTLTLTQWYRYTLTVARNASTGAAEEDITVTLSALFGDPDLAVYLSGPPNPGVAVSQLSNTGGGVLRIAAASVPVCHTTCAYYFAVTAYRNISSLYTIRVTTGPQTIALRAGIPYTTSVQAKGTVYFALQVDHSDALAIVVTSLSGDADVYASFTDSSTPLLVNTSNARWSSIKDGTDMIPIGESQVGTYYILVFGYNAATFTILAALGATGLINGQPQHDYLGASQYRIYVFDYGNPADLMPLSFSVVPTGGGRTVNMYASASSYPSYPNNASSTWSSVFGSSNYTNVVTIPIFCQDGLEQQCVQRNTKYYLRIDAQEPTQYDVTAYYGDVPTILSAGRPLTDVVGSEQCKYYRAYIAAQPTLNGAPVDVSIDVTEAYGDVSVYVSFTSATPTQANANLSAPNDPSTRSAHVGIDLSALSGMGVQPNAGGVYPTFIAVCGQPPYGSSYSIVFTTFATLLPIGVPQSATSRTAGGLYFFVQSQVAAPSANASIVITFAGDSVDGSRDFANTTQYSVYGCNDQLPSCFEVYQPNALTASFASPSLINGQQWPLPTFNLTNWGTYWLGVWTSQPVNFTVVATQRFATSAIKLSNGGKLTGQSVSSIADPEYYYTQLRPGSATSVVVDVCYGQGQLASSTTEQYPSLTGSASSHRALSLYSQAMRYTTDPVTGSLYLAVMPNQEGSLLQFELAVSSSSSYLTSNAYLSWPTPAVTVSPATGGFDVKWNKATPTVASTTLSYAVYYTTNDDAVNVNTVCGAALVPFSLTSGIRIVTQSSGLFGGYTASVRGLPAGFYKVGVMAGVAASPLTLPPLPTNQLAASMSAVLTVSVTSAVSDGYSSATLAAVTIPIVLIVVAALAYLCYRNTKLQAQLTGTPLRDMPRQQVLQVIDQVGLKRKGGGRRLNRGASGARYNKLGYKLEEGTEMSVSELGLEDEGGEEGEHMDGGLYGEGEEGEEQRTYTLDAVLEHIGEDEEKEDSLTFDD